MNVASQDGDFDRRAGGSGLERRWWTLIAVCGATFMLLVDVTVVGVSPTCSG
jgi:hypothetical protein